MLSISTIGLGLAIGLAFVSRTSSVTASDGPAAAAVPDYEAHLAAIAPSIVSLKYLAAYDASSEYPMTCHGFIVDPTGLIVLSNDNFGEGTVKIRAIKALLGNDPKERPAVLVARDTTLDLAYVQILDLEGKTLPAIDLEKGRDPKIGENLFGVTRAERGFDYAPSLLRLYVTSRIESPRLFWDFSGEFGEDGLPAFDASGRPVGVIVLQQSAEGSDEGGGSHSDLFILPLNVVTKSLAQVRKRVPEVVAKAREAAKEPVETPKEPAMGDAAMDDAGMGDAGMNDDAPKAPEPAAPGSGK